VTPIQRRWAFAAVRREIGQLCPQALKWVGYPEPKEQWSEYRHRAISDATLLCASEFWHAGDCERALETMRTGLALLRSAGVEAPD
jgi:hypothetical protein